MHWEVTYIAVQKLTVGNDFPTIEGGLVEDEELARDEMASMVFLYLLRYRYSGVNRHRYLGAYQALRTLQSVFRVK